MVQLDVSKEEVTAISLINVAFSKAIFPMVEGDEMTNLATARARLTGLAAKLAKYIKERDAETTEEMMKKAKSKAAPKDPIKKESK